MKPQLIISLIATVIVFGGFPSLFAQDKSNNEEVKRPDGSVPERADADKHRFEKQESREHRGPQQPAMKPTSFIGIMTRTPSPDVRAQVGVPEGFGLLVEEIMEASPAKDAGIKQYDVLVLLDDQRLVNMDQLSALIRDTPKDSSVVFTLKRGGKEEKISVKVGEKMMAVTTPAQRPWGEQVERFGQQMREQAERVKQQVQDIARDTENKIREERERFMRDGPNDNQSPRKMHPNGNEPKKEHGSPRPQSDDHRGPPSQPPGNDQNHKSRGNNTTSTTSSMSSSAAVDGKPQTLNNSQRNVIRRDDSGEYSLSENNGKKTFMVKPTGGANSVFDVSTADQIQALPEAYQGKLHELDRVGHDGVVAGAKQ